MKKLKIWIAVDGDGVAFGYEFKPLSRSGLVFLHESGRKFYLGKLPSHAGKCWRQEIEVPPVAKKRGSAPSSEPQTEWWDNRK